MIAVNPNLSNGTRAAVTKVMGARRQGITVRRSREMKAMGFEGARPGA